jgi:hypothetical protein
MGGGGLLVCSKFYCFFPSSFCFFSSGNLFFNVRRLGWHFELIYRFSLASIFSQEKTASHVHWKMKLRRTQCSQIHSPLLGDQVDYGIGLSYRPASLCSLKGRYIRQPFAIVNTFPSKSGTLNWASEPYSTDIRNFPDDFFFFCFFKALPTTDHLPPLYSTVHNWSICTRTFIGKNSYLWLI